MFARKKIVTGVVTLGVALATGHVMQYGIAPEEHVAAPAPRPSESRPSRAARSFKTGSQAPAGAFPSPDLASGTFRFPQAPTAALESNYLPKRPLPVPFLPADGFSYPPSDAQLDLNAFGISCDVGLVTGAAGKGMVSLALSAGCNPDSEVLIRHGDLVFTDRTDAVGRLDVALPALEPEARIDVTIHDVTDSVVATVPDAVEFDRVVLLSDAELDLSIHGIEPGVTHGGSGTGASILASSIAADGEGEVALDLLGGSRLAAEVLTLPAGRLGEDPAAGLSVKVAVTPYNCGRTLVAQVLSARAGAAPDLRMAEITVPDCSSVGDTLVLKNLAQDMKIAQK